MQIHGLQFWFAAINTRAGEKSIFLAVRRYPPNQLSPLPSVFTLDHIGNG